MPGTFKSSRVGIITVVIAVVILTLTDQSSLVNRGGTRPGQSHAVSLGHGGKGAGTQVFRHAVQASVGCGESRPWFTLWVCHLPLLS